MYKHAEDNFPLFEPLRSVLGGCAVDEAVPAGASALLFSDQDRQGAAVALQANV